MGFKSDGIRWTWSDKSTTSCPNWHTTTTNTEIIKISVIDKDRGLAADIANEIVKVLGEEIKSIYKLQNVSVIDKAVEADAPDNINYFKEFIIYILAGIVLACAIIFIVYYFDELFRNIYF